MAIVIPCSCGATLRVPDTATGKSVRCPQCHAVLPIPAQTSISAAPRPPPSPEQQPPLERDRKPDSSHAKRRHGNDGDGDPDKRNNPIDNNPPRRRRTLKPMYVILGVVGTLIAGVVGSCVLCCGGSTILGSKVQAEQRQALVDGDQLVQQGRHAEALAKFKHGFPQANARSPEIIAKIVESALATGNDAEARSWVARANREKLTPPYGNAGAALSAGIQQDLAQAKAADVAKRQERELERERQNAQRLPPGAATGVTRANYNRVQNGMTLPQVESILESPQTVGWDRDRLIAGDHATGTWQGGVAGGHTISITFVNGRVIDKAAFD